MPKMKLSYCDRLDQMRFVMKTKHDNDLTNRISAVYIENYTELSRPIRLGTIYTKMREQRCDQSDKSGLCRKGI